LFNKLFQGFSSPASQGAMEEDTGKLLNNG